LLPSDVFTYQDLGVHELKSVGPLRLFRVAERKGTDEPVAEIRPTAPLIGRSRQLGLLADHWELAKDGIGQAVIVVGEAGIGKSKLVQGFQAAFGAEAHTSLSFQGSPFHRNTMLYPVIEQIQLATRILPDDRDAEKFAKLSSFLRQFSNQDKLLPLVSRLLSNSGHTGTGHIPSQRLLQQTLDILVEMALQHANRGPTLFIFEDVHWFDPTTMNFLEALIPLISNERALLLLTTRSPSIPQLQQKYYFTQIALARLRANEVEDLIHAVTGEKSLPHGVHTQILNRANGVPLYVEELTKMVLDAEFAKDQHDLISEPDFAIPLTLRDPLTSRVDRVKGRRVLQLAATLGKKFSYELLLAVSSLDAEILDRELRHLISAELLYQKGTVLQEATFEFKHSLIRDAAYALLTKAERETYHKRVASLLEERFSETAIVHPEIVAYHYTQARSYKKAVHYWYEAGKESAARSAHKEAVGHLEQGLKAIPGIEDPILRNKSELLLQTSLGKSLRATMGWSTDSVKHAYTRGLQLCRDSGLDEHTLPAVFGLWTWNFLRAALGEAHALADHLLNAAGNVDDAVRKVLAHEARGFTLFAQGKFEAAHTELERSIGLCEDSKAAAYLDLSAQDPRVHVRSYDSMTLWFLGYPDQALRVCAQARSYADESQDPFSQAMERTITLRVHQFRGEAAVIANQVNAVIAFCQEHEFVHYLAMVLMLRGWATAYQGEFEKGIAEIQEGLEKERATGALLFESYSLGLLADACIRNGRHRQAFDYLQEAQSKFDAENASHFYEAEIYRLLGETHLRSNDNLNQAEQYFSKGLKIAREQKAKSLELRLCSSIYDLCEQRQNADKYRSELGEVYGSFSEGFAAPDLVTAKARLENA
ncbi:MAG TPA: AAA family ATPase, partial [Terriglobales bacterium]|nr:AAA family ATPase [Terriglobales bacterium]